jgi:drug/metabolite transporter (DMT)-like permease
MGRRTARPFVLFAADAVSGSPLSVALGFALLAALGFSVLDALRKHLSTSIRPVALLVYVALSAAPIFGGWALVQGRFFDSADYFAPASVVLVLHVVADLLFLLSVRWGELGKTVPFLSFSPVFASLLGVALLDESLTEMQWLGVSCVVVGGMLLGASELHGGGLDRRATWAQLMMMGVGACWAGTTVFDKLALGHASPGAHGLFVHLTVGLVALAALSAMGRASELVVPREHVVRIAALAPVGAFALGCQFLALAGLEAGLVEAIKRAVGTSLAFLVGALVFGERFRAYHVLPLSLLVAGTFLVR